MSFAIPEDVAHVDAIAHLLEILVRILSGLRWEGSMRSTSVRPKLTEGRPTCKNDTKVTLEGTEVVRWNDVPCAAVSHETTKSDPSVYTGSILIECLLGNRGRPTNAQHCGDQTKTEENV